MAVTLTFTPTGGGGGDPGDPNAIAVLEVATAAPNVIAVIMRDALPTRLGAIDAGVTQAEGIDSIWRTKTHPTAGPKLAMVLGPNRDRLRFADEKPAAYVDRDPGRAAANWSITGGLTVARVGVFSEQHDTPFYGADGPAGSPDVLNTQAWRHTFYLQLSGNIASGTTYTITPPSAWGLASIAFPFNDTLTRSLAIHVSTVGYRPGHTKKVAVLSQFVPNGLNYGAVDLVGTFGLSTFKVMNDATKVDAHSGTIPAMIAPSTDEPATWIPGTPPLVYNNKQRRYLSSQVEHELHVASYVVGAGTSTITLATGHGARIANNEIIGIGVLGNRVGDGAINFVNSNDGLFIMVKNLTGDTFTPYNTDGVTRVDLDGSTSGAYTGSRYFSGTAGKLYKTYLARISATYESRIDFSAYTSGNGTYRIRVPGLGVSDSFPLAENACDLNARFAARGDYHQRLGAACDGRFGFTQAVALRNGQGGVTLYESKFPDLASTQAGAPDLHPDYKLVPNHVFRCPNWVTTTTIDGGGGHKDAGDWDVFPRFHVPGWLALAVAYEMVPSAARVTNGWNFPKASDTNVYLNGGTYGVPGTVLDWTEMDSVPVPLQQLNYAIAWMFRCQKADGSVPGGQQGTNEGRASGINGIGEIWEASSYALSQQYTYAPDHSCNYFYACAAAILGRLLVDAGAPVIGNAYIASAVAAFNWADTIFKKIDRTTSTTSLTIGTGSKTLLFTTRGWGPTWTAGDVIRIRSAANNANYMQGTVTTGSTTGTGAPLTVNVTTTGGSGTFADWQIVASDHDRFHYYDTLMDARRSVTFTGTTTTGSAVITGIASTATLQVGDHVTGPNIRTVNSLPPEDAAVLCKIKSIDSASQVTLENINTFYDSNGVLIGTAGETDCTGSGTVTLTARRYGMGMNDATLEIYVNAFQKDAARHMSGALGALARATGTAAYRTRFESGYKLFQSRFGQIQYLGAAGTGIASADATCVADLVYDYGQISQVFTNKVELAGNTWGHVDGGGPPPDFGVHGFYFGEDLGATLWDATFNAVSARRQSIRECLGVVHNKIFGMTQGNRAFCIGWGPRSHKSALHDDGFALNQSAASPDGIVLYGLTFNPFFSNTPAWVMWGPVTAYSFALDYDDINSTEATVTKAAVVSPSRFMVPGDHHWDARFIIYESEYGNNGLMFAETIPYFLSRWDGNIVAS